MKRYYLLWHPESECLWIEYHEEGALPAFDGHVEDVTGNREYEERWQKEEYARRQRNHA